MKIKIADHHGFCFGVRDAIAQAEDLLSTGRLTVLGEIVHNPTVQHRLLALGAHQGSLSDATAGTKRVLITPHGASDRDRRRWLEAGYRVLDATCPLVRHAHQQLAALVCKGFHPVVIGKRNHTEVVGLIGDFPGASVIESETEIDSLPVVSGYGIVSQTTQPIDRVRSLVEQIQKAWPNVDVRFCDTVCQPTKARQVALKALLEQVEAMVIIGGLNSNNTVQLVAATRKHGLPAFHIEKAEDLVPAWFDGLDVVGITAGTSTPPDAVEAVRERMATF